MSTVDPVGLASCTRNAPSAGTDIVECAMRACYVNNKMFHDGLMEPHRKEYASSVLHAPIPP